MKKDKKTRHSIATYCQGKGETPIVCLEELAQKLSKVKHVPERFTLLRATEISLLAWHYLDLLKKSKETKRRAK